MGLPLFRSGRGKLLALTLLAAVSLTIWSCDQDSLEPVSAPRPGDDVTALQAPSASQLRAAMSVQERHTPQIMAIDGVVGTAISLDSDGMPIIKIYTEDVLPMAMLPADLDGYRVVQHVSGPLEAFKGPPSSGGDNPRVKQTPPVKMGTSGGWRYDLANGYCCGGTLGSLVQIGGTKYVLSNYHVLYSDIVQGGNSRTWQPGDPVIQPGLIDVGCNAGNAQNIATLVSNGGSLPNGNVDAGIAQIIPGMVDESGAILNVGTISAQTVAAFVGQAVKKMGRTTGLSRAAVDGLNATVSITYANECAGGTSFTKTFTGQIIATNKRCKFLDGGDSGSLMVEDVTTNPRAVGLLFAGSTICGNSAIAVANPIGAVLGFYGATMVGQ